MVLESRRHGLIPTRIASDSPGGGIPKAGNFQFDSLMVSFASGGMLWGRK